MKYKIAALALLSGMVQAEECGTVTIADMNWSSASLIANVDKFILEHGYGCETDLVPGDTMPTGTSMIEKGEPDIAPELWSNAMKAALDAGVAEKRLRYAGDVFVEGGEEGFWVPKFLVDKYPELSTIEGVIKHADLFKHPEDKSVSGFYGCPAGWNCQISSAHLFDALNLDSAGFELIDPGSSAGLAGALAKSYEREEGWFGYYWAPTAVLGKYEMVKVDFGSGVDLEHFKSCLTQEECPEPKASMYPPSPVHTVTTEAFASKAPEAFAYVSQRQFSNADMNKLLAWMEDNQADGEAGMHYFLETQPTIWKAWVSASAAEKIAAAL